MWPTVTIDATEHPQIRGHIHDRTITGDAMPDGHPQVRQPTLIHEHSGVYGIGHGRDFEAAAGGEQNIQEPCGVCRGGHPPAIDRNDGIGTDLTWQMEHDASTACLPLHRPAMAV